MKDLPVRCKILLKCFKHLFKISQHLLGHGAVNYMLQNVEEGRSNGSKICWDMLNVGTEEAAKNIVGKQELEKHCQI